MAATSPYNCTDFVDLVDADCAPEEGARVRHLALVETSEMPTNPLAITSDLLLTQETAGTALIYRKISGTYDGGAEKTGPGYGSQQERVVGKSHTLDLTVPQLLGNEAHAESLEKRAALYTPIWWTEGRMWVGPAGAQPRISVKNAITESTSDQVAPKMSIVFDKKVVVRTYTGFDMVGLLSGTATTGAGGTTNLPAQT